MPRQRLVLLKLCALAVVVAALVLTSACAGSSSTTNSRETYVGQIGPPVVSATDAMEEWTSLADEHGRIDLSQASVQEIEDLLRNELDAAAAAYEASSEAVTELRAIVPPDECKEVHQASIEYFQLIERAFLETIRYLDSALRGRESPEQRIRSDDLFDEVRTTSQDFPPEPEATKCFGP